MLELASDPELILSNGAPPVLDGRCDEEVWRAAASLDLGEGILFMAHESGDHVFVCVRTPADSARYLDMNLATASGDVVNLHVSAQVGERVHGPQGWPAYEWRNNRGWYGTPLPFAGRNAENGELEFAPGTSRELAIGKSRFGPLPWRVRIDVRGMNSRQETPVVFPVGTDEVQPLGWLTLRSTADTNQRSPE